jgi:hypothetical protein
MSHFLTSISTTSKREKRKKEFRKKPFSQFHSLRQQKEMTLHGIIFDAQLIDISILIHKIAKLIEFVHFRNLTQRLNSKCWFSICCVCGIKNNMIFVSDLLFSKALIKWRPDSFRPGDIIAIANCKIERPDQMLVITPSKIEQLIKIGINENIEKCHHISDEAECCGFIDRRIQFDCPFHKEKYASSSNRMVLRQQSDVLKVLKVIKEEQFSILDRKPKEIISQESLDDYVKTFAFKRGAKLFEASSEVHALKKDAEEIIYLD